MRRREALRVLGGSGALALAGVTTARGRRGRERRDDPALATLGRLTLPGAKEVVVADGTAYVAVTDGFAVVDLSDPMSPVLTYENRSVLADHEDGSLRDIYDVAVDGDRLAVTGPVTVHETDFFNHNCALADDTVYLCGNDGERNALVTVDAATGERLGDWSVVSQDRTWQDVPFAVWPLHDVSVQDGTAYLAQWDAGTWMVDVRDPATPELVGRVRGQDAAQYVDRSSEAIQRAQLQPPGNDHFAAANDDGSLVCISVEAWDAGTTEEDVRPGALHLYDVSDPTAPKAVATIPAPETPDPGYDGIWTTSHNFEISGDTLVSSWYQGGVRSYDISDPSQPILTGAYRDVGATSFWTAQHAGDGIFVASSRGDPGDSGADTDSSAAALFTFQLPDTAPPETPEPTQTPTSTPTPTATQTATSTPTDVPTTAGEPTPTTGQPGFGVAAALAGIGLAAWRRLRGD
ncbi:hypothetical protein BRD04_04760 [Halobacteriales archaeon QS_9_67_17]|nr:MAG: hypothetical protein BRD04_04760 [Halobacteriales archaeon QS_9_67_17]